MPCVCSDLTSHRSRLEQLLVVADSDGVVRGLPLKTPLQWAVVCELRSAPAALGGRKVLWPYAHEREEDRKDDLAAARKDALHEVVLVYTCPVRRRLALSLSPLCSVDTHDSVP